MKCKEITYYLVDYFEGKLIDEIRREIRVHISFCHSCKTKLDELKTASRSSREKFAHEGDVWEGVTDLNEYDSDLKLPDILFSRFRGKEDPVYKLKLHNRFLRSKWIALGLPLVSIILGVIVALMYFSKTPTTFWQIETLKGNPIAGNQQLNNGGVLPNGVWLKTDATSEAVLKSGVIGDIDIAPESEIKLVGTSNNEYKLYLKSGKISARTWSPPDFFKIEIPSVEIIDLGCAFTIEAGKDNSSKLYVSSGWVALKSGKEKFIVPAGMICETNANGQTDIPYFVNTSSVFKDELVQYDSGRSDVLEKLLLNAKYSDKVSLWYLLKSVDPDEKKMIYDKLAEFVTPPENVNYIGIMNGDNAMFLSWWEKLGCGSRTLWNY